MIKHILYLFISISLISLGQGFPGSPSTWAIPAGGKLSSNTNFGFNSASGGANPAENLGSQTWSFIDMNGDKKPDLVVTAQLQGTNVTCFSPGNSPYWKVFLNSGTGFSIASTNWVLPTGGKLSNNVAYGFDNLSGTAFSGQDIGSQTWALMDMNADSNPDLVVTAQLQGTNVTCFSPGSSPFWKVYLNSGSGFATTATNWAIPTGGKFTGNISFGYNGSGGFASVADDQGSQSWGVSDIDGDNKPDLIVAAQLQGTNVTSFSPASSQFWKVYLNNGSGFSTTASNWSLPSGGKLLGNTNYGFNNFSNAASPADDNGSQSWALLDINGDKKSDLVVYAQLQGTDVTSFSPNSSQYWKVFFNNGNGFTASASNWALPSGGKLSTNNVFGFNSIAGFASGADDIGSQSWTLLDINADNKTDLLITAQLQGPNVTCFSPGMGQYWKVFFNNGAGFTTTTTNWSLPGGGKLSGNKNYGFMATANAASPADDIGSQSWAVADMNGDNAVDLFVPAQLQGTNVTVFSPGSAAYWKVYAGVNSTGLMDSALVAENNLSVFPNPSGGSANVHGKANSELFIYNVSGALVVKAKLNEEGIYYTNNLKPGVYLLSHKGESKKLIITE